MALLASACNDSQKPQGSPQPTPQIAAVTPPASPGYGGLAGLDFFRTFLAAKSGDPMPADALAALRVLEVLDAAYAAAASGCAVDVEHRDLSRI